MDFKFKKLTASVLASLMALSTFPAAAFAATNDDKQDNAPVEPQFGYIHVDMPTGSQALTNAYLRGDTATRDPLPAKYDGRTQGYLPAIRNQNPYGTCWAFGTTVSVEAYMIKHGIINAETKQPANTSMDLSESHLAWFNYTYAYDKLGMLNGDSTSPVGSNFLNLGGNGYMSTFTLMRGAGPASESNAALKYSNITSSGINSSYAYNYDVAHVSDVQWIPFSNRDAVKRAIMEYGAGGISYYHNDGYLNYNTAAYCAIQNSVGYGNHLVAVVGWDDNYSRTNFSSSNTRPSSNGAWIIRNSWGTSWGDRGYFYLSYEDSASLQETSFFYKVDPLTSYENCYQYDGSGCLNYNWIRKNGQVANVFKANGRETLNAVSIALNSEDVSYTVQVYKNPSSGNPSSGTLMTTQQGYSAYPGYRTIALDQPVSLSAGDTFSVVYTLSVGDGSQAMVYYDCTSSISWASFVHANHGATSYYKQPGYSWTDCPNNGDFRIKAYTTESTYTVNAVSNNNSYGTVSVNGNKITATPANGYYVSDVQVSSGTATFTREGNIITVNPTSNCTIKVIFAKKSTATVNFIANGSSAGSQSAYVEESITLPTSVSNVPSGWTFEGWTAAQLSETANKPSCYAPGAEYVVTGNTTLYALYSRTEGTTGVAYKLISGPVSDWNGKYVITSGNDENMRVLKALNGGYSYESSTSGGTVSMSSAGITLNNSTLRDVSDAYVFELAPSCNSCWSIRNVNNGTYLSSDNTSTLYSYANYDSTYSRWFVEYDSSNACMKVTNAVGGSYPYLVVGSNGYFVVNSIYTTYKTYFWKKDSASESYYTTDPTSPSVTKPVIISHPSSVSVEKGSYASFSVSASGSDLHYQWQYKKANENTWTNWSGMTSASIRFKGVDSNNGNQYRCVVSNTAGSVTSNAATLTVKTTVAKPVITSHPVSASVEKGNYVTFSVTATGSGLRYQWQYKRVNETSWSDWSGMTGTSISFKGVNSNNGNQYRCVVSNAGGSVTSNAATLTVNTTVTKPTITSHPVSVTVDKNTFVTFSITASGSNLRYQWQYKRANETSWTDWSGKTGTSISFKGVDSNNGNQYRCVVSNAAGSVSSNAAKLTVNAPVSKPSITGQPASASVEKNSYVTFSVTATGSNLHYQWQYKRANETSWTDWSGMTGKSISFKGVSTNDGNQYRCVVSNSAGSVTSNAAKLTVTDIKPVITSQPESVTTEKGSYVSFSVAATGSNLCYQWQFKRANESNWTDWSGATSKSISFKGVSTNNGNQYRCVITNESGSVTSNAATLTVADVN